MSYIDAFVIPVPRRQLAAYRKMAELGCKVWMDHGALDYRECVAEDLRAPQVLSFPKGIRARRGETVLFSWIAYKSRAHRDKVNARAMKDPRLLAVIRDQEMPFDMKRMLHGGFAVLVSA